MTETPYLEDTAVVEFEATVERRLDDRVVLDRTHFYPEGGGQPADHGTLADGDREWDVVDVQKKDTIYHYLEGPEPPAEGTTVTGRLDEGRRRGHMRHHTAQHLLSAHVLNVYDAETTGNQVYADRSRLDVAHDRFSEDDMAAIEDRMNELVAAELPVRWYEMDRERAEAELDTDRTRIDLLPDSITELRIVEIGAPGDDGPTGPTAVDAAADDPYDRTACAGTHVETTAELGTVAVTGRETKGSDEERLTFELRD